MNNILHFLSIYSIFLPLLSGLLLFRYLDNNGKLVLCLIFFATIPQMASVFYRSEKRLIFLYNFYIFFDFSFWAILFYKNIIKKTLKNLIILLEFAFTLLLTYYLISEGLTKRFLSELVCLDNFIQIIWVSFYFYEKYKGNGNNKLEYESMFWFCIGILIYAPCTYFLFAFKNYISGKYSYLWRIHDLLNCLLYLSITFGLWVNKIKYSFPKN